MKSLLIQLSISRGPDDINTVSDNTNEQQRSGSDDIPCYIVNLVASFIRDPLINFSFTSGKELKIGKCIPLHRKGDITNINNDRPLCLQSVFANFFEQSLYHF